MNPESISELNELVDLLFNQTKANEMNNTRILSRDNMAQALRTQGYIVGSWKPGSGLSFAENPVVHATSTKAAAECARLADLHHNTIFFYVKLMSGTEVVTSPRSISY